MITYQQTRNPLLIQVLSDNVRVGTIATIIGKGFQYFPKNSKKGGEIFQTLEGCKLSLETELAIPDLVKKSVNDVMRGIEAEILENNEQLMKTLNIMVEYAKCMAGAEPILEWMVSQLEGTDAGDDTLISMVNKAKEILTKLKKVI